MTCQKAEEEEHHRDDHMHLFKTVRVNTQIDEKRRIHKRSLMPLTLNLLLTRSKKIVAHYISSSSSSQFFSLVRFFPRLLCILAHYVVNFYYSNNPDCCSMCEGKASLKISSTTIAFSCAFVIHFHSAFPLRRRCYH